MAVRKQICPAQARAEVMIATVVCLALVGATIAREAYRSAKQGNRDGAGLGWLAWGVTDCNLDGIPDDAAIALGINQDCNGNGIPDVCDTADGNGDCNGNGMPDSCELDTPHGLVGQYCGLFWGVEGNYEPLDNYGPFDGCLARIDPTIDFDWSGSRDAWPGLARDHFEIVWTGYVETPDIAGEYTFYPKTDDGVRLYVDGQLLVDEYYDHGPIEFAGTITLEANTKYRIVMEYYENQVWAVAELRWEPPGQSKVIIPTERLYPGLDCNNNGAPDDCDIAAGTSPDLDGNGIPDECEAGTPVGDMNCDGLVNFGDIDPFVLALTDPAQYAVDYPDCDAGNADINGDGLVNFGDIDPFVALLTGP